jgi:hypothetical protein
MGKNCRFDPKIKLPGTIASKHQVRGLMFEDSVKKAEAEARAEVADSRAKNCL